MAVMKVKSSVVLAKALEYIKEGYSVYACCAIQLVETDLRFEHHQDIKSNALSIFHRSYVIANSLVEAEAEVSKAYPGRVITDTEKWQFNMVVF